MMNVKQIYIYINARDRKMGLEILFFYLIHVSYIPHAKVLRRIVLQNT